MKYFIDTEFIEGFSKWTFAKNRHFIDLISIGIIAEDGRTYYAISNEFNPDDADQWVKDNVLYSIMKENGFHKSISNLHGCLSYDKSAVKLIQKRVGKSNKQIAEEIAEFVNFGIDDVIYKITRADCWSKNYYPKEFEYIEKHNTFIPNTIWKSGDNGIEKNRFLFYNQPEFYGYYADYDWVLFCSLFGRMIDLPKGFPMYCMDLKQSFDEKVLSYTNADAQKSKLSANYTVELYSMPPQNRIDWVKKYVRDYPAQVNEHNALDDAKWNLELYNFIQKL